MFNRGLRLKKQSPEISGIKQARKIEITSELVVVWHLVSDVVLQGIIKAPLQEPRDDAAQKENHKEQNVLDQETGNIDIPNVRYESDDDDNNTYYCRKKIQQNQ